MNKQTLLILIGALFMWILLGYAISQTIKGLS